MTTSLNAPDTPLELGYEPRASWGTAPKFDLKYLEGLYSPHLDKKLLKQPVVPAPRVLATDEEFEELRFYRDYLRPSLIGEIRDQNKDDFRPWDHIVDGVAAHAGSNRSWTKTAAELAVQQAHVVVMFQKKIFNRARSYQVEPALKVPFAPPHPAYPSGHSTESFAVAFTLAAILGPGGSVARLAAFHGGFQAAMRVARNREVAGVHYASDTRAGVMLAEIVVSALLARDPDFQQAVAEARKDWAPI